MQPRRLIELKCPECEKTHCKWGQEYLNGVLVDHTKDLNECRDCHFFGYGFSFVKISPPGVVSSNSDAELIPPEETQYWIEKLRKYAPHDYRWKKLRGYISDHDGEPASATQMKEKNQ